MSTLNPHGNSPRFRGFLSRWFLANSLLSGALALLWLIFRSGTKPSRLAYPCQRAAVEHGDAGVRRAARRGGDRAPTAHPPAAALGLAAAALGLALTVVALDLLLAGGRAPRAGARCRRSATARSSTTSPVARRIPAGTTSSDLSNLLASHGARRAQVLQVRRRCRRSPGRTASSRRERRRRHQDQLPVGPARRHQHRSPARSHPLDRRSSRRLHRRGGRLRERAVQLGQRLRPRRSNNAQDHGLSPHDVVRRRSRGRATTSPTIDWTVDPRHLRSASTPPGNMNDGYIVGRLRRRAGRASSPIRSSARRPAPTSASGTGSGTRAAGPTTART